MLRGAGLKGHSEFKLEVFVINLDRRPDRLAAMTKMLDGLGLKFQRVAAVDGRTYNVWQHANKWKAAVYSDLKMPSAGTVACYLSHRQIWEDMVRRKVAQAMIFEDDVIPINFDPAILDVDLTVLGLDQLRLEEWDQRDPGRISTQWFSFPILGRQAVGTPSAGTGCYIVTLKGAEKLLRAGKFWFTVDHFDVWERAFGLRTAVLRPKMFNQADTVSDIDIFRPSNELLPAIFRDFLFGPRPSFAAGALRLGRWVKRGARDSVRNLLYVLGLPFKHALLFYAARSGRQFWHKSNR